MEQGHGKLFVEIFDRAGDADRCGQSVIVTFGDANYFPPNFSCVEACFTSIFAQ